MLIWMSCTEGLIVIEGADGSGRASQIAMLNDWLEGHGRATVSMGLRRSNLIASELDKAKQGMMGFPSP